MGGERIVTWDWHEIHIYGMKQKGGKMSKESFEYEGGSMKQWRFHGLLLFGTEETVLDINCHGRDVLVGNTSMVLCIVFYRL